MLRLSIAAMALPNQATPNHASARPANPLLPCQAGPGLAAPWPALQRLCCREMPCHVTPRRAVPSRAVAAVKCRAVPSRTTPSQTAPCPVATGLDVAAMPGLAGPRLTPAGLAMPSVCWHELVGRQRPLKLGAQLVVTQPAELDNRRPNMTETLLHQFVPKVGDSLIAVQILF